MRGGIESARLGGVRLCALLSLAQLQRLQVLLQLPGEQLQPRGVRPRALAPRLQLAHRVGPAAERGDALVEVLVLEQQALSLCARAGVARAEGLRDGVVEGLDGGVVAGEEELREEGRLCDFEREGDVAGGRSKWGGRSTERVPGGRGGNGRLRTP